MAAEKRLATHLPSSAAKYVEAHLMILLTWVWFILGLARVLIVAPVCVELCRLKGSSINIAKSNASENIGNS